MNTSPKPKPAPLSPAFPPAPIQEHLRFVPLEAHSRVPEEQRAECVALLRKMMEAVAGRPNREEGGAND